MDEDEVYRKCFIKDIIPITDEPTSIYLYLSIYVAALFLLKFRFQYLFYLFSFGLYLFYFSFFLSIFISLHLCGQTLCFWTRTNQTNCVRAITVSGIRLTTMYVGVKNTSSCSSAPVS